MLAALRTRLDSWRLIACFGLIYAASQIAIAVVVRPLGSDPLRVQTTLDAAGVRAIFARWDAAGLTPIYAAHYRYDMIHPLWYGVLLAALLATAFRARAVPARWDVLLLLPFAAALCDVVENLVHLSFLADRTSITPGRVLVGNGAALLKWALVLVVLAMLGWLALARRGRAPEDG
jgi:hypothetical protein